jgi:phosphatidylserine decarboxylase
MSPINVHVTRYAISGIVKFSIPSWEIFWSWHPKASEENERTTIVIENNTFGSILYRQVAGALARRIVNYAEEGMQVVKVLMLVSLNLVQVDLFLPIGTPINVVLNQKQWAENHYCYKSIMIEKN